MYIAGLPLSATPDDIAALARPFGTVVETRVNLDAARRQLLQSPTATPRFMSGMVRMTRHEEAEALIAGLNGQELRVPGDIRRYKLTARYANSGDRGAQAAARGGGSGGSGGDGSGSGAAAVAVVAAAVAVVP